MIVLKIDPTVSTTLQPFNVPQLVISIIEHLTVIIIFALIIGLANHYDITTNCLFICIVSRALLF